MKVESANSTNPNLSSDKFTKPDSITGFDKHGIGKHESGLDQVINRGMRPNEILDAFKNPRKILQGRDDIIRMFGKDGEIRINQLTGKIKTVIRFHTPDWM